MNASSQDDGFKWFGEGFDGFPKRLPDDCMEYIVYVIDAQLKDGSVIKSRLNNILKASQNLVKQHLTDYIWQRDPFTLALQSDPTPKVPSSFDQTTRQPWPRLKGRTAFGDSVADEWVVVYLLLEISKQFSDAWIRVYDTDGEFLLIEAAAALPKWLNPEIAENRVWINSGHLRIIPADKDFPKKTLSVNDALSFIREQPEKLIVSPYIEDEAFYRLREYPAAISSSLHHALVSIPRPLAFILHHNPAYISPAVEAFYLRDPISSKPLSTKDTSTLSFPPEDFVTVSAKFTKVGYAQLHGQVYEAPPAWTGMVPRMQDPKAFMGMKLACGFEMMLSDPQNQDKREVREIRLLLADLDSGEDLPPSDAEIASWSQQQDDEKWLDIDYNDFEKELSGRGDNGQTSSNATFGDSHAQENLRKMVSRFEEFLKDEDAGAEGIDEVDSEVDDVSDSESTDGQDMAYSEDDFKQALRDVRAMDSEDIEDSGLLAEARRLALEDAEDESDANEDEEMKKVMDLMEQELKSHGALKINNNTVNSTTNLRSKPVFGPERPPHMQNNMGQAMAQAEDDDASFGNGELSSDDEDFDDVDLGLASNMLESFKGQAGLAGPAGNLMRAMGITLPRDDEIIAADEI